MSPPRQIRDSASAPAAHSAPAPKGSGADPKPAAPKAKPPASVLSSDLVVVGNLKTTGDIQVEGTVGRRARPSADGRRRRKSRGEIVADDVIVNGRVVGRVRGPGPLTSTARVEGDIIHKTIAIESGAHFEGSVQRQDDPLSTAPAKKPSAES